MSRLLEVGGILGLLTLAVMMAESARRGERPPPRSRRVAAALVLALAVAWTVAGTRDLGRGDLRPLGGLRPLAMARFLGAHGQPGERVFTALWADAAPLFYTAPQLTSLVVLDPTFFYAQNPQLFERYWAIAHGRSRDPVGEITQRFGARYVTIWKVRSYEPLGRQMRRDRRAQILYQDRFYEIWRLDT